MTHGVYNKAKDKTKLHSYNKDYHATDNIQVSYRMSIFGDWKLEARDFAEGWEGRSAILK